MLPLPAQPPEPSVADLRAAPGDGRSLALYWTFYWAVAAAQLARWLPRRPSLVLDISGGRTGSAAQAAAAGHTVLEMLDPLVTPPGGDGGDTADGRVNGTAAPRLRPPPAPDLAGPPPAMASADPRRGGRAPRRSAAGVARRVIADSGSLACLRDASVDAVVAEDRALSRHLVTESTVAEIARVLRPGGRVLLSVDSLTLGMALLAEQSRWAHLSDVPSAEVLLVPWPDGTITRCFWVDQLRELLTDAGLEVEWIRPRTALSPSTVEHVLAGTPRALARLVRTELSAPVRDDSLGVHLLASARRV
ncbi:methyltransferase domain-containing protein [Actinomadura sp. NPDC047616]|uniref:methyltransferase domain-containing protein n=1 Tax=Actinomadura sp. NPDC047616 TaxID=3155914 RepID=UPI0033FF6816